jgi:predicted phage tail protein
VNRGIRFFRDEEVELNRSFVYAVSAVDSVGNISEPARSDTLITSNVNPPLPAHNVIALAENDQVNLRWQTRKSDASIRSFAIMRASIATGRYEEIGRTSADELSFTDTNGEAGLWYRVYPVDATGRRAREARNTQAVRP